MLSIDYAVMEKSKVIYTLSSEFGRSDLGSLGSLRTLLPQDEAGNTKVGKDDLDLYNVVGELVIKFTVISS